MCCFVINIRFPPRLDFLFLILIREIELIFQAPAALRLPLGGVGPFLPSDEGIPRERKRRREAERGGEVHNGGGEIIWMGIINRISFGGKAVVGGQVGGAKSGDSVCSVSYKKEWMQFLSHNLSVAGKEDTSSPSPTCVEISKQKIPFLRSFPS